jgi:DNA polymerase I-like protein with 3'-5' exonuclease and polymerase domains
VPVLGLDVETNDPRLHTHGPGGIRGDGHLAGISISDGVSSHYFPINHIGDWNVPREPLVSWLSKLLGDPKRQVVGANLLYDVEWLHTLGITIRAELIDVQVAEPLIEEEATDGFSLDALSRKYLGAPKDEALLTEAAKTFGIDPKRELWKLPPRYVGPYAEWDAMAAIRIWQQQQPIIAKQYSRVWDMEKKVLPIIWKMRKNGVRINRAGADKLALTLGREEEHLLCKLNELAGMRVDIWSGSQLAIMCRKLGIEFAYTQIGNPSFTKDFVANHDHPAMELLNRVRTINRLRTTFTEDLFTKFAVGDRIYPQWRQLASDEGGTRTGRMASANPNMQQIPSRAEEATLIRALFIPDDGMRWAKIDYSQQEPRLLVHYASLMNLTGARLVKMAYNKNPHMDIYEFLSKASGRSRREAKGATLGRMYGMGAKKYAAQQGLNEMDATKILDDFDRHVPFVREIADRCAQLAETRGYIRTLGGRHRHFNLWEPSYNDEFMKPCRIDEARVKWPNKSLRRYGTRKALNALIQGSAADMTKLAMIALDREGITPCLAVHDELDLVVADEKTALKCQRVVEECVTLEVPVIAELDLGDHWK